MSKSFTIALKEFMQMSAADAMKELKVLTSEEKQYFYKLLKEAGVDCLAPGESAVKQD